MRKMQAFAPEINKLKKKYANDKQRQAQEMQKLQKEHGVNPLGGCLPMLLQIPVFIGLNHVLRSFTPTTTQVYFFGNADVQTYLKADLFGAHLGDALLGIGTLGGSTGWHWDVAPVAIPLMIAAAIATHFTARLSVSRQLSTNPAGTPQSEIMQKVTLWVFPLGVLVFGGGFPVGLLLYWLSNNGWTLGQQHFVFRRMDKEEAEKKVEQVEQRAALAPKPGQKPTQVRRRPANAAGTAGADGEPSKDRSGTNGSANGAATKPATAGTKPTPGAKPTSANRRPGSRPSPGTKPAPGAKPAAGNKPAPGAKPAAGAKATGRSTAAKPAAGAKPSSTAQTNGGATNGSAGGAGKSATAQPKQAGKPKVDGTKSTSGSNPATPEIPGLVPGRSRRNKQDRKGS
jgi:YidC/Oxa1 family membrane protein insertase